MPCFNQSRFFPRAIASLKLQQFQQWELIFINDGSTDDTEEVFHHLEPDSEYRYIAHSRNRGLGAALNAGIEASRFDLIAYLPCDDVIYGNHLQLLCDQLIRDEEAVLAYGGVRYHYNRQTNGHVPGFPLQLVQVAHRKTEARWIERAELVTDDLDKMFWSKLRTAGKFISTNACTCEWVDHPEQRHKIIREPEGGLNLYKQTYGVNEPLRFHSTVGNLIDERDYYQRLRQGKTHRVSDESHLKILLVGELAYNPERMLALEDAGCKLYGLWMSKPYWYNYTGPLSFGNIQDLDSGNWRGEIDAIKPDVIYGLLNWQAVPFAWEVMMHCLDVPFVWHFKEGPFICLEKGTWGKLIDLYRYSDGQIYCSPEMRIWFEQFVRPEQENAVVIDGDLPHLDWFGNKRTPRISLRDGSLHTVVPGRPIGLHPEDVAQLASLDIHIHFYGDFTQGQWKQWIERSKAQAGDHLHIHPNCAQPDWTAEFSQYDAGWLHFFKSANDGELMRANWDDLNYPARIATLAIAGLPMLQRDNTGHIVATQSLVQKHGLGLFFSDFEDLKNQLVDEKRMNVIREKVWSTRTLFAFHTHVPELLNFFKRTIEQKSNAVRHHRIFPPAVA